MAVKKAIITDAGFASRYLPITKTIPRAMIPIGAKPVMQLCVEECVEAGIEEIIIVATPNTKSKEIYEDYVLILGDMGELGENEVQYHRELGEYIFRKKKWKAV